MAHPNVADGIDDQEAKIVTLTFGVNLVWPQLMEPLLSGTNVHVEERTIQLPLAGETLLAVIRIQDQSQQADGLLGDRSPQVGVVRLGNPSPRTTSPCFSLNSIPTRNLTGFSQAPILRCRFRYGDTYWEDKESGEAWAAALAHEIAHYYFGAWASMKTWIAEGAAQTLGNSLAENHRVGKTGQADIKSVPIGENHR